jgi:ATPase subunit of ABC transporter with duplicated ATPase domains
MSSWIISVTTFNRERIGIIGKNGTGNQPLNLLTDLHLMAEKWYWETIKLDITRKAESIKTRTTRD